MQRFFLFLLSVCTLSLSAADYDCVFVGTSPIPLFEAIYQEALGKKVLILEEAAECGGVWKSINICGVPHVDMGCHQIGKDLRLAEFLGTYGGCRIVSFDNPFHLFRDAKTISPNGFYFSKGCYELIGNLLRIIRNSSIELRNQERLESVALDPARDQVLLTTGRGAVLSAKKVFMSYTSCFSMENKKEEYSRIKSHHLYLLLSDPTPPKFSYLSSPGISGVSRAVNLTCFSNLKDTGRQLIVLQLMNAEGTLQAQKWLNEMKSRKLVDASAYLLQSEPYVYCQGFSPLLYKLTPEQKPYFEILSTGNFNSMTSYLDKWMQVLKPYEEMHGFQDAQ